MENKTPSDFSSHDDWFSHVREKIPAEGQFYALAYGRTEPFPVKFTRELEHIRSLREPERTSNLESLNQRIFAGLTELLFHQTQPKAADSHAVTSMSPREEVHQLLDHLTQMNPYFALWIVYKSGADQSLDAEHWEDYLRAEFGPENENDIVFTRAMAELDKLLTHFGDRNLQLPKYFFERCGFLHHLRGPERILQTRALLNTLTTESGTCASA